MASISRMIEWKENKPSHDQSLCVTVQSEAGRWTAVALSSDSTSWFVRCVGACRGPGASVCSRLYWGSSPPAADNKTETLLWSLPHKHVSAAGLRLSITIK